MAIDITLYVVCALLVRINFTPMPHECKGTPGPNFISEHSFEMRSMFYNDVLTETALKEMDTLIRKLSRDRFWLSIEEELLVVTDKKPDHPVTFFGLKAGVTDKFYYQFSADPVYPIVFKGRNRPRIIQRLKKLF